MSNVNPVSMLKARIQASSHSQVAAELCVSPGYLGDVVRERRPPSPRLLQAMGLERVYRKRKANGA